MPACPPSPPTDFTLPVTPTCQANPLLTSSYVTDLAARRGRRIPSVYVHHTGMPARGTGESGASPGLVFPSRATRSLAVILPSDLIRAVGVYIPGPSVCTTFSPNYDLPCELPYEITHESRVEQNWMSFE